MRFFPLGLSVAAAHSPLEELNSPSQADDSIGQLVSPAVPLDVRSRVAPDYGRYCGIPSGVGVMQDAEVMPAPRSEEK